MKTATLDTVLARIIANNGFIDELNLSLLAECDRLRQILVRCGSCRFTCAAQDAAHLIRIIHAERRDYVRDVSLPTTDPVYLRAHTYSGDLSLATYRDRKLESAGD
jgi:hypothetical protein